MIFARIGTLIGGMISCTRGVPSASGMMDADCFLGLGLDRLPVGY